MNLKGRLALITGAAGGIGKKIAEAIAELGGDLILVDLPGSNYTPVVDCVNEHWKVNINCCDCDLENGEQRKELVRIVTEEVGSLDILINNAGFVGTSDLKGWVCNFENQSVETWRRAFEVNLTATFDLVKGLAPVLRQNKTGSIINMASIYAVNGPDYSLYRDTDMGNPAAYAASKGGLVQMTRWLGTTLAPDIRVNAISPGGVFRNQPEQFVRRYEERTPLGRMAKEDDFKGSIAFLASDLSAYVTGQNLLVDGGWTIW